MKIYFVETEERNYNYVEAKNLKHLTKRIKSIKKIWGDKTNVIRVWEWNSLLQKWMSVPIQKKRI